MIQLISVNVNGHVFRGSLRVRDGAKKSEQRKCLGESAGKRFHGDDLRHKYFHR
jgi:hypothetical protein